MKTTTLPVEAAKWYIVDAANQSFGRLSANIAHVLRGKHEAHFSPHQLCGGHVIVINASQLAIEPRKAMQKTYFSHTGYLGHKKNTPLQKVFAKNPATVIEKAVQGMLPKNRLRAQMMKRLHVFNGAEHTHEAQKPISLPM